MIQTIRISAIASFFITLALIIVVSFLDGINSFLIKTLFVTTFITACLTGDIIILSLKKQISDTIQKQIIYASLALITFAFLVFYNILSFSNLWNIAVGFGVIFLMVIQLQINGWSLQKQSLISKIIFAFILIANLFISVVFFLKLNFYQLEWPLYLSSLISILSIFYGYIFYQNKLIQENQVGK